MAYQHGDRFAIWGNNPDIIPNSGGLSIIVFVGGLSFVFFKVISALGLLRVSAKDELAGLDLPEMGSLGYPKDWEPSSTALKGLPGEKGKVTSVPVPVD
jgi:hypothetical protein